MFHEVIFYGKIFLDFISRSWKILRALSRIIALILARNQEKPKEILAKKT